MTRNKGERPQSLPDEIKRQFSMPGTGRFLRAQPWFRCETGLPERFVELLAELDQAEGRRSQPARQGR